MSDVDVGTELSTEQDMNRQIHVYDRIPPITFIDRFGKIFAMTKAGGCKTEQEGQLMALACLTERKTIFQIAKRYHLMDGKLVTKSEAMLSDFKKKGGKVEWIKDGTDGQSATLKLTGADGVTQTYTFTIDMARSAGYVKDGSNWKKRPDQMLRARCTTDLMRMQWPEISDGDYTEDEIEDSLRGGPPQVTVVSEPRTSTVKTTDASATRSRSKKPTIIETTATRVDDTANTSSTSSEESVSHSSETIIDAETEPTTSSATPAPDAAAVEAAPFDVSPERLSEQAHSEQVEEMSLTLKITAGIRQLGWQHDDILKMCNGRFNSNFSGFSEFPQDAQQKLLDNIIATAKKSNITLDFSS